MRPAKHISIHARLFGNADPKHQPECALVVAHPGDEVSAAGCLISRLANISIIHITDGASHNGSDQTEKRFIEVADYALARREECLTALHVAGVPPDQVVEMHLRAQEAPYHLTKLTKRLRNFIA